jgi:hypothetical protein
MVVRLFERQALYFDITDMYNLLRYVCSAIFLSVFLPEGRRD